MKEKSNGEDGSEDLGLKMRILIFYTMFCVFILSKLTLIAHTFNNDNETTNNIQKCSENSI